MPLARLKLEKLALQLDSLQKEALQLEEKFQFQINKVHPKSQESARNLLHYLALRHRDVRKLQQQLTKLGLSSLGRSEEHVLASIQAVRRQLSLLLGESYQPTENTDSFNQSFNRLKVHTDELLGKPNALREVRIMVTFDTDLASNYALVGQMMQAGMNCARINCAHDNALIWEKMVANIKRAEQELGLRCKILFDLMGPKLRTGPLKAGPSILAIHPVQNEMGKISAPAKVWVGKPGSRPPVPVDAIIPFEAEWLSKICRDQQLKFKDCRGRKRALHVIQEESEGIVTHLYKSAYLTTETTLRVKGNSALTAAIGDLPYLERPIILKKGDYLIIHQELIPGEDKQLDDAGNVISPAHISCTLPEIFTAVKPGEPILFDDGQIEGEILEVNQDQLLIKITAADQNGSKLRADKGINLPESDLCITTMTAKDKKDLAIVVQYADIVNLSFVNHPNMVTELRQELKNHQSEHLAIMLKIETKEGFRNLPFLLLAVMRHYPAGIMIARGDLAVECGWQRLAEVQEEILWFCEAAHLPVVWATQVLETVAKKGRPSRAEITDAAMAQRADCVMLNKGTYILKAIAMLDDILKRMQQHQYKKTPMLRNLHVSELDHFYHEAISE